jgi:hypothetical protein
MRGWPAGPFETSRCSGSTPPWRPRGGVRSSMCRNGPGDVGRPGLVRAAGEGSVAAAGPAGGCGAGRQACAGARCGASQDLGDGPPRQAPGVPGHRAASSAGRRAAAAGGAHHAGEEHRLEYNEIRPHEAIAWNRPQEVAPRPGRPHHPHRRMSRNPANFLARAAGLAAGPPPAPTAGQVGEPVGVSGSPRMVVNMNPVRFGPAWGWWRRRIRVGCGPAR